MFSHHCTDCERTQLFSTGQITRLSNTDHGIVLSLRCWCGSEQSIVTGKNARRPRVSVAA